MKNEIRHVLTIRYLLLKLYYFISDKHNDVLKEVNHDEKYKYDRRITSLNYPKSIVFSALLDLRNYRQNIVNKEYLEISSLIGNELGREEMIITIANYPIYNFIVRFYSIIESGCRGFVNNGAFTTFTGQEKDVELVTAYKILKDWRNSIHKNGVLDNAQPITYNYRGRTIEIIPDKVFKFNMWNLYRISKDCIEFLHNLAIWDLKANMVVKVDNYEERTI